MKSKKHLDKPVKILFYEDKYSSLIQCLNLISKKDKNAKILIIGRNNKDMDNLYSDRLFIDKNQSGDKKIFIKSLDYPELNIRFLTAHGSKGLEEDYVIIVNGDDAKLGFPNKIEDDIILNVLLSSKDIYQYSEERRLWYVALTRTRNYTYILSHKDYPSMFVEEIKNNCEIINDTTTLNVSKPLKCPVCKSTNLILRVSKDNHEFYGCRNFPCCTYTTSDFSATNLNHRCSKCNDFTVIRQGKYNKYYKCINKLCGNREYFQESNYYNKKY